MILYGVIVLKRNVGAFIMFIAVMVPGLLFVLIIAGFLYGTGPLRRYIESKAKS